MHSKIKAFMTNELAKNDLAGLVLCGGKSTRMGFDKSLLQYHAAPQLYHLHHLLLPFCSHVWISCNQVQAQNIDAGINYIVDDDKFNDIGPMKALLTAFEKFPNNNFLVVGCDYPFINATDIEHLISNRKREHFASTFYNSTHDLYEPMIGIYENEISKILLDQWDKKKYSLQQTLKLINATKVLPLHNNAVRSVDSFEEYTGLSS